MGKIPMDVACVIASKSGIGAIERAESLKVPHVVIDPNQFRVQNKRVDPESFGLKILKELRARGVTVVTQNGWLPLTPQIVIDEFQDTIFNQHPGPLPEFGGKGMYGKRVHAAVLLFTRRVKRNLGTEAIAQRVNKDFDQGPVVKAEKVDILRGDIIDDLQQRVLPIEHKLQIELLQDVARGNIGEIAGRKPFMMPGEEQILFQAKVDAISLYPHG